MMPPNMSSATSFEMLGTICYFLSLFLNSWIFCGKYVLGYQTDLVILYKWNFVWIFLFLFEASKTIPCFFLFFLLTNLLWALLSNFGAKMYTFFSFFHKFVFTFFVCFFQSTVFYYLIGIFINKRCIICFCSTKCVIMKPKSSSLLPYTYIYFYTKKNSF